MAEDKCEILNVIAAKNNLSPNSRLIECPKTECSKKYRDLDALKYHLSFSHNDLKKSARQKVDEMNGHKPSGKSANGPVKKEEKRTAATATTATVKEEKRPTGEAEQKPVVDLTVKQEAEVKKESGNGDNQAQVPTPQKTFFLRHCHRGKIS